VANTLTDEIVRRSGLKAVKITARAIKQLNSHQTTQQEVSIDG
jgi:hypothetical protein